MFDQINLQPLALSKSYTDAFVKAQGLALAGFERITELNLKTFEDRVKASVDFWSEAAEVRDIEAAQAFWPKSAQFVKESAEKLYANGQEVLGISLKTSEAIGALTKSSLETASKQVNDSLSKTVKAGKKAA
ncbi:MAG: phasin family protein [Dokdonella sp.]|uniref:phasin family protein n=1 Tax=Dokdonella sp. TaxID=2291710 RepID=UPI0025C628E6|nr:phasin family protein [Dokdonella sp.]MBX3700689.1 phasin family protein [Dokdonella sp.]